jgi:uncharacterized protein
MPPQPFFGHSLMGLTDSEIDELHAFLLSGYHPDGTMMLETIDGFFASLIIGPVTVMPSAWLPLVWDLTGGGEVPDFESLEQAQRLMEMLIKMSGSVAMLLSKSPDSYNPLPDTNEYESDADRDSAFKLWATGFMIGVSYNEADWEPAFSDETASVLLSAISMLSVHPDDIVPLPTKTLRELWKQIPHCVCALNDYWRPARLGEIAALKGMAFATEADRIGRNEPCPCGSGKKFKKCCGM